MHNIVTTTIIKGAVSKAFIHTQNTQIHIISSLNVIVGCSLLVNGKHLIIMWQTILNGFGCWIYACIWKLIVRNEINEAHIHLFIHFKEHLLMRKPHRCKFIHICIFPIEYHSTETNWMEFLFFYPGIFFTFYHQPFSIHHRQTLKGIEQNLLKSFRYIN